MRQRSLVFQTASLKQRGGSLEKALALIQQPREQTKAASRLGTRHFSKHALYSLAPSWLPQKLVVALLFETKSQNLLVFFFFFLSFFLSRQITDVSSHAHSNASRAPGAFSPRQTAVKLQTRSSES
jgi:hypothetical protein